MKTIRSRQGLRGLFTLMVLGHSLASLAAEPLAPAELPQPILQSASEFLELNSGTPELHGKSIFAGYPIHAYGVDGVAYYEVWLTEDGKTPHGWLLLSATDKDYVLVNFSHDGTPYSQKVLDQAAQAGIQPDAGSHVYRFGVSFFSLEDDKGNLLASYGQLPTLLPKAISLSGTGQADSSNGVRYDTGADQEVVEGVHFDAVHSYDDLRRLFPDSYYTAARAQVAAQSKSWISVARQHQGIQPLNAYQYRWITNSGTQAYYTQIPANYRYNTTACWSGCNNNAWASLYGWWDLNKGKASLIPTTSTGETSPAYRNTTARQDSVDPVIMWLRNVSGTYCGSGTGWTKWSDAYKGYQYAGNKGYGYDTWWQWCNSTGCNVKLADIVTDGIANNYTPVHVGANSHFYVGWGWAQYDTDTDLTWVYGYPGWKENHDDDVWIWWHDLNTSTRHLVY